MLLKDENAFGKERKMDSTHLTLLGAKIEGVKLSKSRDAKGEKVYEPLNDSYKSIKKILGWINNDNAVMDIYKDDEEALDILRKSMSLKERTE